MQRCANGILRAAATSSAAPMSAARAQRSAACRRERWPSRRRRERTQADCTGFGLAHQRAPPRASLLRATRETATSVLAATNAARGRPLNRLKPSIPPPAKSLTPDLLKDRRRTWKGPPRGPFACAHRGANGVLFRRRLAPFWNATGPHFRATLTSFRVRDRASGSSHRRPSRSRPDPP